MDLVERYRSVLNVEIIDHRHESLVADFEGALRPLTERIGLGWSDAMCDVGARVRQGITISQSAPQIRAGVNASGVAHWRRYQAHLAPILDVLAPWVKRFGYAPS